MAVPFRLIDTAIRGGTQNIAFDAALIELHKERRIPDTLRFLQFTPTALVGRHQDLSRELRRDYCAANNIGLARRVTGGGALYMDEGQFGFELVFRRQSLGLNSLGDIAQAICDAAAAGLSQLGVKARYRPRNDIEVGGRKISGTGGFFDGDTIFYQGTVLVQMDTVRMLAALNVPQEKIMRHGFDSAQERVTTLAGLLGTAPPVETVKAALCAGFAERLAILATPGAITEEEEALAAILHAEEIGTSEFLTSIDGEGGGDCLTGSATGAGGTVRVHLRLEGRRIREILITGDFFVTPPRVVYDLEARLRGVMLSEARGAVMEFFSGADIGLLTLRPEDFADAIGAAAAVTA